jgi:type I restriction enzyme S subunit
MMVTIGDIFSIEKGHKALQVHNSPQDGKYRYIQIEDLRDNSDRHYVSDDTGSFASKKDILIAWDGANAGTVSWGLEGYAGSTIAILKPTIEKEVYTPYFGYFLRSKFREIQTYTSGATIPHVQRYYLDNLTLEKPEYIEQKRIAGILEKSDRLRRLRKYARELSDTYLQSLFMEMFGDETKCQIDDFDTLLLEKPKNGLYLASDYYGSGFPIIRITDFYDGILSPPFQLKRVNASLEDSRNFSTINDDILINRVNSLEYLGKCALVKGLNETTLFESNMMRIRVDSKRILPVYIVKFLSSKKAYRQIFQLARKAVNQASINQEDVMSLRIIIPPMQLQQKFTKMVQIFERLQSQQQEAERQTEHLFQTLLHHAFNGELN